MLIDKGYYDYDYSEESREKSKMRRKHNRTEAEQKAVWERMGFGHLRRPGEPKPTQPITPEDMQRIAMEELKEKKANG